MQTAMADVLEMQNRTSHTSEDLQQLYDSLNTDQRRVVDKVVGESRAEWNVALIETLYLLTYWTPLVDSGWELTFYGGYRVG